MSPQTPPPRPLPGSGQVLITNEGAGFCSVAVNLQGNPRREELAQRIYTCHRVLWRGCGTTWIAAGVTEVSGRQAGEVSDLTALLTREGLTVQQTPETLEERAQTGVVAQARQERMGECGEFIGGQPLPLFAPVLGWLVTTLRPTPVAVRTVEPWGIRKLAA